MFLSFCGWMNVLPCADECSTQRLNDWHLAAVFCHGGNGESLVPPYTRGSVSSLAHGGNAKAICLLIHASASLSLCLVPRAALALHGHLAHAGRHLPPRPRQYLRRHARQIVAAQVDIESKF